MKSLNHVQLIGHVGSDPESKSQDTACVVKFSIATSENWVDKLTLQKQTQTEWHKIVCFNKLGEIAKTYLKKGSRIYLSGQLKSSRWQDKNNENRTTVEIIADELILLDSKANE